MCPLRFILVFFSAILAGYFAWRSLRSSPEIDAAAAAISADSTAEKSVKDDKPGRNLSIVIKDGFWMFVDMASGRYLWRNIKEMMKDEKAKSS